MSCLANCWSRETQSLQQSGRKVIRIKVFSSKVVGYWTGSPGNLHTSEADRAPGTFEQCFQGWARWDCRGVCAGLGVGLDHPCRYLLTHDSLCFCDYMNICSSKGLQRLGKGCSGKWWDHHLWKCSTGMWVWNLGTRFGAENSGAGLLIGVHDLRGFFLILMILWFGDSNP